MPTALHEQERLIGEKTAMNHQSIEDVLIVRIRPDDGKVFMNCCFCGQLGA
jgi:hypothetical protein